MPERVQLSRARGWRKPEGVVVVARPTRWGNPWVVLVEDGRRIAVEHFAEMFSTDEEARLAFGYPDAAAIRAELVGKDLACWCPLDGPCHADVLIEIANRGGD